MFVIPAPVVCVPGLEEDSWVLLLSVLMWGPLQRQMLPSPWIVQTMGSMQWLSEQTGRMQGL